MKSRTFVRHAAVLSVVVAPAAVLSSLAVASPSMDDRLKQLESQVADQQARLDALKSKTPAARFAPDISLILSGDLTRYAGGHAPDYSGALAPGSESPEEGLSIGHSELVLAGNIDDRFFGQFIAALERHDGETELDIEDASVMTTVAPGATVKAGRFLSAFGYHNEMHEHAWDVSGAPLVWRYTLGDALVDEGLQAAYTLPTETFVKVGVEALRGTGYPATEHSDAGNGTVFVNVGGDLGEDTSWLIGASGLRARAHERPLESEHAGHGHDAEDDDAHEGGFDGHTDAVGVEAVLKHALDVGGRTMPLKLQAEWIRSRGDGTLSLEDPDIKVTETGDFADEREGYYLLARLQWAPQWASSVRYDRVDVAIDTEDELLEDLELESASRFDGASAALDWLPSEFSRVRLQYGRERLPDEVVETVRLNYTMSLGAHGAHRY